MFRNGIKWLRSFSRLLLLALCLTLVCCSRVSAPVRANAVSLAPELAEATIALVGRDSDGDVFPICAGVFVAPREILTAAHCAVGIAHIISGTDADTPIDARGAHMPYVVHRDYRGIYEEPAETHDAVVVAIDEKHDLALLSTGPEPGPRAVVTLADSSPPIGSDVIVVGHTVGMYYTQLPGTVSAYYDHIKGLRKEGAFMQLASPANKGNSGGGVFDSSGRLVGILSWMSPAPGVSFAVHLGTIKRFLHRG